MKKRLSVIMIICLLTMSFAIPVYADTGFFPEISPDIPESYKKPRDMLMQIVSDVGQIGMLGINGVQYLVQEFLNGVGLGQEAEQIQNENDAFQWLNNGIAVSGNNVSITGRQYQFIKYYTQNLANTYAYRTWYTLRLQDYQLINNQNFIQIVNQYHKDYYIIVYSSNSKLMLLPKQYTQILYRSNTGSNGGYIDFYDIRNNSTSFNSGCLNFTNFVQTGAVNGQATNILCAQQNLPFGGNISTSAYVLSNQYEPLTVFNVYSGVSCNQVSPYYTTGSYNSNMTKDSYNTTTSNIDNSMTSQDVYNYVNNYYNSNDGNYPSPSQINVYIENNIPENNPSGGGGGGSGGSGGSGSGDGETGIFDFLSKIGEVLGNLIKNLGNVLSELVEGIASTITALFESIPTVFGDFLGALLGWLPAELRALITLSISAIVIVGLIKLFRG